MKIRACGISGNALNGGTSSQVLANLAAGRALELAKRPPIPLVIYAGIYRDRVMVEPAQAPFVQRALGGVTSQSAVQPSGCFSFDVDSLLAAVEVADSVMLVQNLNHALVVAADGGELPPTTEERAPMASAGALVLERSNDDTGFVAFHARAFPEHRHLRQGAVVWQHPAEASRGRQCVIRTELPGYLEACIACAASEAEEFLTSEGVPLTPSLLVLPSQGPVGFVDGLQEALGLVDDQIVRVPSAGVLETAGPIAAFEIAQRDGRAARATHVLWLTVQPGISVSAALYRNA